MHTVFAGLLGTFAGDFIRLFSEARLKYGHEAVYLRKYAPSVPASDLMMSVTDIVHIDLSGINFHKGEIEITHTSTHFFTSIRNISVKYILCNLPCDNQK